MSVPSQEREMSVPSQEREMCFVLSILPLSTIFLLGFGTVPTVWYLMVLIWVETSWPFHATVLLAFC
jgi:hypothetical protein